MNQNISLADYAFSEGEGFAGEQSANDLIKAMQAGQITGRDTANLALTQEPLKVESLETALKLLTFRMKDIALWNAIPKMPAYNTVEEFLQHLSYGADRGGFYDEGALSDVEDSVYMRKAELVKYIQVTGEVTYQAQIVKSYVPAMQKEIQNKMMWVLRKANSAMTKADSKVIPQEWNSLYAQHASIGVGEGFLYDDLEAYYGTKNKVVVDLRGRSLIQDDLEDGAIIIDDNFGTATDIWAPPTVLSDLGKDFYESQRILLGNSGNKFVAGGTPKSMSTTIGEVNLSHDKFMKKRAARLLSDPADSIKTASAPASVATALSGADTLSKFTTDEGGLGTVYYAVASINAKGESALTVAGAPTATTLTNGQSVNVTITPGSGANPATGFVIYRSKVTASVNPLLDAIPFYPLFTVSNAERVAGFDGGSAGVVRDRNRFLPDTEEAFMTEMNDEVLSFKQLAPLSKLDLAVLSMSRRFITFLFGTPNLYAPKKMVRYINVGRFVKS
jgi:hypothetical protein